MFFAGYVRGGRLTSHDTFNLFSPLRCRIQKSATTTIPNLNKKREQNPRSKKNMLPLSWVWTFFLASKKKRQCVSKFLNLKKGLQLGPSFFEKVWPRQKVVVFQQTDLLQKIRYPKFVTQKNTSPTNTAKLLANRWDFFGWPFPPLAIGIQGAQIPWLPRFGGSKGPLDSHDMQRSIRPRNHRWDVRRCSPSSYTKQSTTEQEMCLVKTLEIMQIKRNTFQIPQKRRFQMSKT